MKIVMYSDFFPPNTKGGAEIYVYRLAAALQSRGHKVKILTNGNKNYEIDGLKVVTVPKTGVPFLDLYLFYKEIKRYDVFHIHNIHSHVRILSIFLAAKLNNIPLIWTAHDYWFKCQKNILLDNSYQNCTTSRCERVCLRNSYFRDEVKILRNIKKLFKNVDTAIAPSHAMEKNMISFGLDKDHIKQIAYGLPLESYPYSTANPKKNIILFIGSLEVHKGCRFLIEAMPDVIKQIPDAKLLIVGDGSEKDNLMILAKKIKIDNNVEFRGKIPNEKTSELYKQANLVVIPSIWQDVLPIVGLETMAIGRPLIGSDIGGIPDWINNGETGFLFEPRSVEQIAGRIVQILSDDDMEISMGRTARKKVEKEFNMTEHTDIMEKIYERACR
ncbi:MAG TPA: glycosyltransferase family 4 protein [Candidatus Methanoperedens sp.]